MVPLLSWLYDHLRESVRTSLQISVMTLIYSLTQLSVGRIQQKGKKSGARMMPLEPRLEVPTGACDDRGMSEFAG